MSLATRPVQIGNTTLGGNGFAVFAGPCAIESFEQFESTAQFVKSKGAIALRGGMFKLRTNPDTFQGLETEAYELVREVKKRTGLPFISEITDPRHIEKFLGLVDVFQVGSRNMHNYPLLKELGKVDKPVLLKRGFAGLISEWLSSADYLVKYGNENVILCERGIRTFENATRNTFDLNAIAYIKEHSNFPVIADPSHATGATALVTPMALAAAAAGADGIIVEVHPNPAVAKSDALQALNFSQFEDLMKKLNRVLNALDRELLTTENPQPTRFEFGQREQFI